MHKAAIFTALEVEHNAVKDQLINISSKVAPDGTNYIIGNIKPLNTENSDKWEIALSQTGAGQTAATYTTQTVVNDYEPDVIFFVGVAGGHPTRTHHGDIIIGSEVNYFEPGKQTKEKFIARPQQYRGSRGLAEAARQLKDGKKWMDRFPHPKPNNVTVHMGMIVSGEKVITSTKSDLWKFVEENFGKYLCVEMEGAGFHLTQENTSTPGIVIRGISDLLDDKNTTSESNDHNRQKIASERAACFCIELINSIDESWVETRATKFATASIVVKINKKYQSDLIEKLLEISSLDECEIIKVDYGSIILFLNVIPFFSSFLNFSWKEEFISNMLPGEVAHFKSDNPSPVTKYEKTVFRLMALANKDKQSRLEFNFEEIFEHTLTKIGENIIPIYFGCLAILSKKVGVAFDKKMYTVELSSAMSDMFDKIKKSQKNKVTNNKMITLLFLEGLRSIGAGNGVSVILNSSNLDVKMRRYHYRKPHKIIYSANLAQHAYVKIIMRKYAVPSRTAAMKRIIEAGLLSAEKSLIKDKH